MPRPTFLNLDPAKRRRLMQAATAEFARHDFADARLDRIARDAGIPKGSLYQYFDGKEDFYVHTVREALEEAWGLFERHIEQVAPADCFDLLVEAMVHLIDLEREHPDLATLYARVVFGRDSPSRDRLFDIYLERSGEFYQQLIPWGIADGLLDPELPEPVIRFHMNAIGSHFQYVVLTGDAPAWMRLDEDSPRAFARQLVAILRRALAPNVLRRARTPSSTSRPARDRHP